MRGTGKNFKMLLARATIETPGVITGKVFHVKKKGT